MCLFTTDKKLDLEDVNSIYSCMLFLDRGGLHWPSDLSITFATIVCNIFHSIIENKTSEMLFLQITNQKTILYLLFEKKLEDIEIHKSCLDCSSPIKSKVMQFIKPLLNILLNNYSKKVTDKVGKSKNARKIKTFKK